MKILICVGLACSFFLSILCGQERRHYVDYEGSDDTPPTIYGDIFDWQSEGPIEFLEALKERAKYPLPVYHVHGVHYGWVQESDLPALIALTNSEEKCANVSMTVSSQLESEPSTIGHEATLLIEAFRRGQYPFRLNSYQWKFSSDEKNRFDAWCERFLATYKAVDSNQ